MHKLNLIFSKWNKKKASFFLFLSVALAIILFIVLEFFFFNPVRAEWISESELPIMMSSLEKSSQPTIASDGVIHRVLRCQQVSDGLIYDTYFKNPYSQEIQAVLAIAVMSESQGAIIGFYTALLPQGKTYVTLDTLDIPAPEQSNRLAYLQNITHSIDNCSVHLIGFVDGAEFHVVKPVASGKLKNNSIVPSNITNVNR